MPFTLKLNCGKGGQGSFLFLYFYFILVLLLHLFAIAVFVPFVVLLYLACLFMQSRICDFCKIRSH